LACAIVGLLPRQATAQVGILESFFKNLDNVGGFWVYAGFLPHSSVLTAGKPGESRQSGFQGPGLAFMFHLGSAGVDRDAHLPAGAVHRDSLPAWEFELALAYSRITGFRAQDPTFELRGSFMELPRLAWVAQWHPVRRFSPFVGVHMGLVQLQSVAIYDSSGALYPVSGTTYELGGAVGGAVHFKAGAETFSLFVEPGYTLRNVVSLDWGGQNSKTIPLRFPRSLRFTGWEIAAGVEFGVPRSGGH
jgi:hypothetical protein